MQGFQKKSDKIPKSELERAEKLKQKYFEVKNITTFDEHLELRYGKIGTIKRNEFERNSKAFAIGELIKEERKKANMTQTELADKSGTKKTYISRIENGQSDIELSTLFRIIETGLGKQLTLKIE